MMVNSSVNPDNFRAFLFEKTGGIMAESITFLVIGIIFIPVGILFFKKPHLMLALPRTRLLVKILGRDKAVKVFKYFSAPLLILISFVFVICGAMGLFELLA